MNIHAQPLVSRIRAAARLAPLALAAACGAGPDAPDEAAGSATSAFSISDVRVAVCRWWNPAQRDWASIADRSLQDDVYMLDQGYGSKTCSHAGTLVPGPGLVSVYRWWNAGDGDWVTVPDGQISDAQMTSWGYVNKSFEIYGWASPQPGTVPIYRWWHAVDRDWITIAEGEIPDATLSSWGYTNKTGPLYHAYPIGFCAPGYTRIPETAECVTLTPWPHQTDLPDGTRIAIRTQALVNAPSGAAIPYQRWLGVRADDALLDAADTALSARNLFRVATFHPTGVQGYDFPWYNLLGANGQYVGFSTGGHLAASLDQPNAGVFARGWDDAHASAFYLFGNAVWGQVQTDWDSGRASRYYSKMCEGPAYAGSGQPVTWRSGAAPNYACYDSGYVDYFVVDALPLPL